MREVAVDAFPLLLGILIGLLALALGGIDAVRWLLVGAFFGGWVPLYLMPWLRRKAGRP